MDTDLFTVVQSGERTKISDENMVNKEIVPNNNVNIEIDIFTLKIFFLFISWCATCVTLYSLDIALIRNVPLK